MPRRPWFLVPQGLDGDFSVVRLRWRATRLNPFAESTRDFTFNLAGLGENIR